ncbi:zonular occludens toxin domain-containing protein [Lysobacter capsici]|uniref:zonular occludens toxin domain-containing protein n=1 Tax=Lysobacter capsici TaxID=435897 RepID=UPI001BFFEDF7|nr:zonular occludens toxin domain-containing protein [Lysobacter capsici]QWF18579.1 zonular occludens toxin domain-containing protein [Lysobacter capsici]
MIVCQEGLPRSGKSYDTILTHVLPALAAGRHVYARINGLHYENIAKHLSLPVERIRQLLISVAPDEVKALFVAHGDDPPSFKIEPNSLVVIDECHDFYVSSRNPLPTEQEKFFAMHGHLGIDIVLMTQAFKRVHTALVLRVERKCVFTKLTAIGQEGRYVVRFYGVTVPGRFEKISSQTLAYNPAIFPLYKGFQPSATNTGAYTAGSKTVWQAVRVPVFIAVVVLAIAVGLLYSFFSGGMSIVDTPAAAQTNEYPLVGEPAPRPAPVAPAPLATAAKPPGPPPPKVDELAKYPAIARHLLEMTKAGRPRLSGDIGGRYLLEWRTPQGNAIERLTSDQIEAMGWRVVHESYGVVATFADRTILFTSWPVDPLYSQSSNTAQRIREGYPVQASGSPPTAYAAPSSAFAGGATIQAQQLTGYGGIGYGGTSSSADAAPAAAPAASRD